MPWNKEKSYFIREFGLEREAMDCNLDIFYTKVDERRRVNDDKSKNVNVECWLEFETIGAVRIGWRPSYEALP